MDTTVIAARIVIGSVLDVTFRASAVVLAALEFWPAVRIFICSRYCSVFGSFAPEQYSRVSNQLFQLPTATNSATVASTGVQSGKIIFQ